MERAVTPVEELGDELFPCVGRVPLRCQQRLQGDHVCGRDLEGGGLPLDSPFPLRTRVPDASVIRCLPRDPKLCRDQGLVCQGCCRLDSTLWLCLPAPATAPRPRSKLEGDMCTACTRPLSSPGFESSAEGSTYPRKE